MSKKFTLKDTDNVDYEIVQHFLRDLKDGLRRTNEIMSLIEKAGAEVREISEYLTQEIPTVERYERYAKTHGTAGRDELEVLLEIAGRLRGIELSEISEHLAGECEEVAMLSIAEEDLQEAIKLYR